MLQILFAYAVLMEYLTLLDMEEEHVVMKEFILVNKIDLGLFVPSYDLNSASNHLISDKENDLENNCFQNPFGIVTNQKQD
nr:hypothetical protein [Flavobacterium sp.]